MASQNNQYKVKCTDIKVPVLTLTMSNTSTFQHQEVQNVHTTCNAKCILPQKEIINHHTYSFIKY